VSYSVAATGSGTPAAHALDIAAVKVATLKAPLPVPVVFGNWVMRHREFAICGVVAADGTVGVSYCYTRDGPIAEIVARLIRPLYAQSGSTRPEELFDAAAWSNNAILASGVGHRALSLVDVATWDLAAKLARQPIEAFLGGTQRRQLATAIVGYPPSMTLEELEQQVRSLLDEGWRRFKLPVAPAWPDTIARLEAVRALGDELWLGLDANWIFKRVQDAVEHIRTLEHLGLGWVEDIMPPGHARDVAAVRRSVGVPLAMGDEQGGAYHPEALLAADAVDVIRVDASTNGGVTGLLRVLDELGSHTFAPHMFPHVHSRVLSGLGLEDVPIEWGILGNGVDQVTDTFSRPVLADDGRLEPLPAEPGFGMSIDPDWLRRMDAHDPDGLIGDL
jgi:L-alanine-DL-glutamate epimerase-like enolase superfamily enzyme